MGDKSQEKEFLDRLQTNIENCVPETVAWSLSVYGINADEKTFIKSWHRCPHPVHMLYVGTQLFRMAQYFTDMLNAVVDQRAAVEPDDEEKEGCECQICVAVRETRQGRKPNIEIVKR